MHGVIHIGYLSPNGLFGRLRPFMGIVKGLFSIHHHLRADEKSGAGRTCTALASAPTAVISHGQRGPLLDQAGLRNR